MNSIRELKQQEKYKNMLKRKNKEIDRLNKIIYKLEEFIEKEIELYTIELTEENKNKLSIVAPIRGAYKEIYNVLQELKENDNPSFEEMVNFLENTYKDLKSQPTLHEELEEERKRIAKIVDDFKGNDK